MKKKICMICVMVAILVSVLGISAFAYSAAGDGYEFNDNGFYYSKTGVSPEYGWLYAPNGTLIQEGFLREYKYKPSRGMASVTFEDGKSYYTDPSNFMYRTYTVAERQAIGRP